VTTIAGVSARLLTVPLPRPWAADVRENHFIAVTVTDNDGARGHGFSWTPTIGAGAVLSLLTADIARFARGRETDPAPVWDALWRHLHEAGSGGLTTIAMAGLDLALWDLRAQRAHASVPQLIGRRHEAVPTYGSGINRHLELPELVAQARRWVDAGFGAVKIKVGGRPLRDDVARVAAVRDVLGPDRGLMIDANQLWTLEEARAAAAALEPFHLRWIEEPLRADDLPGYRALSAATAVPIAAGENIHTGYRFREFMDAGALSIIQPNVIRVGGITPFLAIAADADARGVPVFPHLLPELSAQVALCLPRPSMVEDVEDSSLTALGVLARPAPVRVTATEARSTDEPGLGLRIRP